MNHSWRVKISRGDVNLGESFGVEAIEELISQDLLTLFSPIIDQAQELVKRCPACGWTETKRIALGYLGCPLCYEALTIAPSQAIVASDLVS